MNCTWRFIWITVPMISYLPNRMVHTIRFISFGLYGPNEMNYLNFSDKIHLKTSSPKLEPQTYFSGNPQKQYWGQGSMDQNGLVPERAVRTSGPWIPDWGRIPWDFRPIEHSSTLMLKLLSLLKLPILTLAVYNLPFCSLSIIFLLSLQVFQV